MDDARMTHSMIQTTMPQGIVFDIKRFSLHDGPGIRTTVFLKGCGLQCWWCHNPESQQPQPELLLRPEACIRCGVCVAECPEQAITPEGESFVTARDRCVRCGACVEACYAEAREMVGQAMGVEEVLAVVRRDAPFYEESGGGVTFSGGEPLLQRGFMAALLRACRAEGLHTTVDTCGYVPTATLDAVRGDVDLFLYDLKVLDDLRHREVTGVSNTLILHNLRHLAAHGHRIAIRVPVIPGINADEASMRVLAELARELPSVERVDLLAYHRIGSEKHARLGRVNPMPITEPPTEALMQDLKQLLESYGLHVNLGG